MREREREKQSEKEREREREKERDVLLHPSAQVNGLSQKCWHWGKQVIALRYFYFYAPPMWLRSLCNSQTAPERRAQGSQPGSTGGFASSLTSPPSRPDEISNSLKYSISNNTYAYVFSTGLYSLLKRQLPIQRPPPQTTPNNTSLAASDTNNSKWVAG